MEGVEMRIKLWLWISALALFMVSVPVFSLNRSQDQGDRSRGGREAMQRGEDTRGYERTQSDREWREYLKEQRKAYKEQAKASREEQRDFERYLRERRKDTREDIRDRARDNRESGRDSDREYREGARDRRQDLWRDQGERDREWREYQRQRNRAYRDYSRASRQEQEDFQDYLRNRNYRSGDRYNSWGNSNEPRNGACFYTDSNYRGERICLNRNETTNNVGEHLNDQISSIRIFGNARVTVYRDKNYGGSRRTFSNDVPHLGDFNDEVTSIEVR
jgi:hypothetical protein